MMCHYCTFVTAKPKNVTDQLSNFSRRKGFISPRVSIGNRPLLPPPKKVSASVGDLLLQRLPRSSSLKEPDEEGGLLLRPGRAERDDLLPSPCRPDSHGGGGRARMGN